MIAFAQKKAPPCKSTFVSDTKTKRALDALAKAVNTAKERKFYCVFMQIRARFDPNDVLSLVCLSSNFITAKYTHVHSWSTLLDYSLNHKDEWRVHNAAE